MQNTKWKEDWQTIQSLHGRKRLDHIWTYYKIPIILVLIVVYMAAYIGYRQATRKEDVLYLALVNVSAVQELAQAFPFPSLMQNNAPDDITGRQRLVEEVA